MQQSSQSISPNAFAVHSGNAYPIMAIVAGVSKIRTGCCNSSIGVDLHKARNECDASLYLQTIKQRSINDNLHHRDLSDIYRFGSPVRNPDHHGQDH